MSSANIDGINSYIEGKYGLQSGEYVVIAGRSEKSPEEIEADKMCSYLMQPLNEGKSWFDLFDFGLAVTGYMCSPLSPIYKPITHLPVLLLSLGLRAIHADDERCIKLLRDLIDNQSEDHQSEIRDAFSAYVQYSSHNHQDDSGEKYQKVVVALGMAK